MPTAEGLFVFDADSHWCERPDLFTSRSPAAVRDRMPHVEDVEGQFMWVFDGHPVGRFGAGGVIARDGSKESADIALNQWTIDQIHEGAYDPKVRLGVLDECGIDAQIIYPSTIGLGGQDLGLADDEALSRLAIEIYNDAQAEVQWSRATGCSPCRSCRPGTSRHASPRQRGSQHSVPEE